LSAPVSGTVGVVGQGFVQIVAEVPPNREPVGGHAHELPLRVQALEEEDKLQAEEDNRVHRRPATTGVQWKDHVPDEREVQRGFELPVEVVLRDQVLQRDLAG
jgi:hypothetical protein